MARISDNGPRWNKAKCLSSVNHTTKTIHHHHHHHHQTYILLSFGHPITEQVPFYKCVLNGTTEKLGMKILTKISQWRVAGYLNFHQSHGMILSCLLHEPKSTKFILKAESV